MLLGKQIAVRQAVLPVSVMASVDSLEPWLSPAYSRVCLQPEGPNGLAVLPFVASSINPLNPELNPMCCLLALLGAHHFLHVSRIRVKSLTFSRLMSYIYMEHPFLMFLDHTQRRSTVGRTPLDE